MCSEESEGLEGRGRIGVIGWVNHKKFIKRWLLIKGNKNPHLHTPRWESSLSPDTYLSYIRQFLPCFFLFFYEGLMPEYHFDLKKTTWKHSTCQNTGSLSLNIQHWQADSWFAQCELNTRELPKLTAWLVQWPFSASSIFILHLWYIIYKAQLPFPKRSCQPSVLFTPCLGISVWYSTYLPS